MKGRLQHSRASKAFLASTADAPNCLNTCTILENISEGVVIIDSDKHIVSFNRGIEMITGCKKDEALGQFCFDVLRADICANNCPLDDIGQELITLEQRPAFLINHQGDKVPVSISLFPLPWGRGQDRYFAEVIRDLSEVESLRRHAARSYAPEDLVGQHPKMRKILTFLPDIAESDSPVLIEGPTGSGKELVARAIHHLSPRRQGPFVAINCAALPDSLLESELFGYKKGAFTGATRDKPGRFMAAHKGTLFLDEICNTSTSFQADLLRVLEEGEFVPLGDTRAVKADFRVIAATNRDLEEMMREGSFREDLYYRLKVVKITLPPLKERKDDIPLLVEHFIRKYNLLKGRSIRGVSKKVLDAFLSYPFPGNIRELENVIEYAYILCKGNLITMEHLPEDFKEHLASQQESGPYDGTLVSREMETIVRTLEKFKGNRIATAKELGISRTTLWRKMKRYGLNHCNLPH